MKICIYTQESIEGQKAVRIKEDRIIRTIRTIKRAIGIARMNELYVSEPHLEEHRKRRKSFEKSMLFASVLAGLIVVVVVFSLLFAGNFDFWAIVSAFILGAFVLVLPLFKYSPALEPGPPVLVSAEPAKPEPAKPEPAKAEKARAEKPKKKSRKAPKKKKKR